jgi:hypothetical protein
VTGRLSEFWPPVDIFQSNDNVHRIFWKMAAKLVRQRRAMNPDPPSQMLAQRLIAFHNHLTHTTFVKTIIVTDFSRSYPIQFTNAIMFASIPYEAKRHVIGVRKYSVQDCGIHNQHLVTGLPLQ